MEKAVIETIKSIINQDANQKSDGIIIDEIMDYFAEINNMREESDESNPQHEALKILITWQKYKSFVPNYWHKTKDSEALALLVAQYFKCSVDDILEFTYRMFEEANMHTYNEEIEKMRQDWEAKIKGDELNRGGNLV